LTISAFDFIASLPLDVDKSLLEDLRRSTKIPAHSRFRRFMGVGQNWSGQIYNRLALIFQEV